MFAYDQGVEVVLDSLAFWQMALDGIQIGLCSLILIYLIRNKIKYNRFVLKPFAEEGPGNFKLDLWIQSIRQQSDQSFDTIVETIERERRLFEKLFEMRGVDPARGVQTSQKRYQIDSFRISNAGQNGNPRVKVDDRYAEVKRLAGKGMSPREISERLKVPFNEVELILKLTRKLP